MLSIKDMKNALHFSESYSQNFSSTSTSYLGNNQYRIFLKAQQRMFYKNCLFAHKGVDNIAFFPQSVLKYQSFTKLQFGEYDFTPPYMQGPHLPSTTVPVPTPYHVASLASFPLRLTNFYEFFYKIIFDNQSSCIITNSHGIGRFSVCSSSHTYGTVHNS